jgi:hypothetical protein
MTAGSRLQCERICTKLLLDFKLLLLYLKRYPGLQLDAVHILDTLHLHIVRTIHCVNESRPLTLINMMFFKQTFQRQSKYQSQINLIIS